MGVGCGLGEGICWKEGGKGGRVQHTPSPSLASVTAGKAASPRLQLTPFLSLASATAGKAASPRV